MRESNLGGGDAGSPAALGRVAENPLLPAQTLGRYMILGLVRSGGVGQVFAAYDPSLDRRVALKLSHAQSKPGDRERMVRGAKALARVSHPNVVLVHEVDEHDGRPLVAMEFVEGGTLKDWVEQRAMGAGPQQTLQALELLIQAARGLVAAHAHGLVHGDFNPGNVLVGEDGRVRVGDFALARASGEAADARCDQFSFCATAWEALYGVRPYPGRGYDELAVAFDAGAPQHADGVVLPHGLVTALHTGLEARPKARHGGMAELLALLEREAELLRPRSRAGRRVRWRYLALAGLLVAGGVGAHWLNQARLARACVVEGNAIDEVWNKVSREALVDGLSATEIGRALSVGDRVMPWIDRQVESWRVHARIVCVRTTLESQWTEAEGDKARWCLEERRFEVASLVAMLADADDVTARSATQAAAGLGDVGVCSDPAVVASMPHPPEQVARAALARVRKQLRRASMLHATAQYAAGFELAHRTTAEAEALGWVPLVAAARAQEATMEQALGNYTAAEALGISAFVDASISGSWSVAASAATSLISVVAEGRGQPAQALLWGELGSIAVLYAADPLDTLKAARLSNLGGVRREMGEYDAALVLHQSAFAIRAQALGPGHPLTADAQRRLGLTYYKQGRLSDALVSLQAAHFVFEEVLGDQHPVVGMSYNGLGLVDVTRGQFAVAMRSFRKAQARLEAVFGDGHPQTAAIYENIASAYSAQGRYDQALDFYDRALKASANVGARHPKRATLWSNIGYAYSHKGMYPEALNFYEKALAVRRDVLGEQHPSTASSYGNLAFIYGHRGVYDEALKLHYKALAIRERVLGEQHHETAESYNNLGFGYASKGMHAEALKFHNKALSVREQVLGANDPALATSYNNIGSVYYNLGEYKLAGEFHRKALSLREDVLGVEHPSTAISYNNVGVAYYKQGQYEQALSYYRKALAIKRLGDSHPSLAVSYANIGNVHNADGSYREALTSHRKALVICKTALGEEHPKTIATAAKIRGLCAKRDYKGIC